MFFRSIAAAFAIVAVATSLGCNLSDDNKVSDSNIGSRVPPDGSEVTDAPRPRISPKTHLAAGRMLETQGDLRGAIEQYEKAVLADPRLAAAYNRLGIIYQKTGNLDAASQMFQRGTEAAPRSAMLRNNLGFCFLALNKLKDAERELRHALSINPNFVRARMNLGLVLARAGRLDESVSAFEGVTTSDIAHYNVGIICLDMGRLSDAEAALKQALAINPACNDAAAYLEHARRLARGDGRAVDAPKAGARIAGQLDDETEISVP